MRLVPHQQPIETLGPNRSHEALRNSVGLRRAKRGPQDRHSLGAKHLVEARREFRVPIPNQKPEGLPAFGQRPGQLPRLLRDPVRRLQRGTTRQVHSTTPQFNEEQHV